MWRPKQPFRQPINLALLSGVICSLLLLSLLPKAAVATSSLFQASNPNQAQQQNTPEATELATDSAASSEFLPTPSVEQLLALWQQRPHVTPASAVRQLYSPQRPAGVDNKIPTFYIDKSAAPGGDGSQAAPYTNFTDAILTVATVAQGLSADIVVAPGVYTESVPAPPNTWIYAAEGYTNTVIIGSVALAEGSGLFGFTVRSDAALDGSGKDIVIAGNRFEWASSGTDVNVYLTGLYNATIVENAFLAGAQVFGNGSFVDNFVVGGQFGLINIGPAVHFEANVVGGTAVNLQFSGSLSNTAPIEVANNLVMGVESFVSGDVPYALYNNTWLGGALELTFEGASTAQVENNIFAYMQTALNAVAGVPQLKNNLFFNNLTDYRDAINAKVIGLNGNGVEDPRFVDPLNLDFHLKSDSPAIDLGSDLTNISRDFDNILRPCDGNSDQTFGWDIGAYEFSEGVNCRPASESAPVANGTKAVKPTQTATPKPVATNTATATATATASPTPTNSETPTETPTATATATETATDTPLPTDTPTATATATATSTPAPTDTATTLPTEPPTPTATVVAKATKAATVVATPIVTSEAAAANRVSSSVATSSTLVGPIAKAASNQGVEWYLLGNGALVASSNLVEPFPLPASLHVRSLTQLGQLQPDLLVAAEDGLYRRSGQSFRWQKISDLAAHFIAATDDGLWLAPDQAAGELWWSADEGITWQPRSEGLTGTIQSPVHTSADGAAWVVSAQADHLSLWELASGSQTWQEVAPLPESAQSLEDLGLSASFDVVNSATGTQLLAGGSDGKLYQWSESGEWLEIYNFGSGSYPLLLGSDELALLDTSSHATHLYRGARTTADDPLPTKWIQLSTPMVDLALGAQQIPDGPPLVRIYGWNDYAAAGYVAMALAEDGALYRFDLDSSALQGVPAWRQVSKSPEHKEFVITDQGDQTLGVLYSGATLTWKGSTCTADGKEFWRSDDQGASWIVVSSDHARQPLMVLPGQPTTVLANTCEGPALSVDGGATWQEASALQWPLETGAALLELRLTAAAVGAPAQWSALYAAGVDRNGEPFLYRAAFDATTMTVGEWQSILPVGMKTPLALFASDSGNTVMPLGNEDDLYVADQNGVWSSTDDGTTWSATPAALQGAQVKALISFRPNATEAGMLAATDQGLWMGPLAGDPGDWIPLEIPFAKQIVGLQVSSPTGIYLNLHNQVAFLPNEFLAYLPSSAPSVTITATVESTASVSLSPTVTESLTVSESVLISTTAAMQSSSDLSDTLQSAAPLSATAQSSVVATPVTVPANCSELLLNGDFEENSGWELPATAFTPSYSTEQVNAGARSLRTGLPATEANRLSYSGAYQLVTLPADASQVTLRGMLWIGNTGSASDADYAYIWLNDANGGLWQPFTSHSDAPQWQPIQLDLSAFRGQTIQLLVGVYNDGADGQIVMYADQMSLLSCK